MNDDRPADGSRAARRKMQPSYSQKLRLDLRIVETELERVAEFVRQLPPLAAMDMASHLGLIKRTLDGLRRRV